MAIMPALLSQASHVDAQLPLLREAVFDEVASLRTACQHLSEGGCAKRQPVSL